MVELPLLTVTGPLPPNLRSLLLVGDFFLGGAAAEELCTLCVDLGAGA